MPRKPVQPLMLLREAQHNPGTNTTTGYLWNPDLLPKGSLMWQQIVIRKGVMDRRVSVVMGEQGAEDVTAQIKVVETRILKPAPMPIYTWGYHGQQVADVQALMKEYNALLVDIRLSPYSRFDAQWNQRRLQAALGDSYVHLPELGNLNYKGQMGEGIHLSDFTAGLAKIRTMPMHGATGLILMCVCKDGHKCHRATVSGLLTEEGYKVTELRRIGEPKQGKGSNTPSMFEGWS